MLRTAVFDQKTKTKAHAVLEFTKILSHHCLVFAVVYTRYWALKEVVGGFLRITFNSDIRKKNISQSLQERIQKNKQTKIIKRIFLYLFLGIPIKLRPLYFKEMSESI